MLESLFNKVAGLMATLLKIDSITGVSYSEFLKTTFFIEHLWWLFLKQVAFKKLAQEYSIPLKLLGQSVTETLR